MELSVGMYVRTKKGIFQIRNKDVFIEDKKQYIGVNGRYTCIDIKTIEKASHTLLGNEEEPCLIEVGDYVNGCQVLNVLNFNDNTRMLSLEKIYDSNIEEEDIKSIVTKEMFSSVEYRVETN